MPTYYLIYQTDKGSSVMDQSAFNKYVESLNSGDGFEVNSFETEDEDCGCPTRKGCRCQESDR